MSKRAEQILSKLDAMAPDARADYVDRLLDYERSKAVRGVLPPAAITLMRGTVDKCGGPEKWLQLRTAVGRVCRARDRRGIADFVRRAASGDDGAVQIAALMLLALTLSTELLRLDDKRGEMAP